MGFPLKAYQGYLRDENNLRKSSSGGAARELCESVISSGGIVFGVKYSEDFYSANYCVIDSVEEVDSIIGSKYIHVNKKLEIDGKELTVNEAVGHFLMLGRLVLFIGLGCEVASVRKYCEKNNINMELLYLVDLICQGPTFPEVQRMYIQRLEEKYKSKAIEFSVRYKTYGWTPPHIRISFQNGRQYDESFYGSDYGYAFGIFSKEACFNCPCKGEEHQADITLGDYWGINRKDENYNELGVSLLLVKTSKGQKLLDCIEETRFRLEEAELERAIGNNPMYSVSRKRPKELDGFRKKLEERGLHEAVVSQMGYLKYYRNRIYRKINKLIKALR